MLNEEIKHTFGDILADIDMALKFAHSHYQWMGWAYGLKKEVKLLQEKVEKEGVDYVS